jgi:hypothetical protein
LAPYLGTLAFAGDASDVIGKFLNFYNPTGTLSGVTTAAIVVWLAVWFVPAKRWQTKTVAVEKVNLAAFVLLAVGLLLTFPPFINFLKGKSNSLAHYRASFVWKWAYKAGEGAHYRRRGDRIVIVFAALHESAIGPKRTFPMRRRMSAIGGKADIGRAAGNVRSWPKADIGELFKNVFLTASHSNTIATGFLEAADDCASLQTAQISEDGLEKD